MHARTRIPPKVEMLRGENSPEGPEGPGRGGKKTAIVSFLVDEGGAPTQLQILEIQAGGRDWGLPTEHHKKELPHSPRHLRQLPGLLPIDATWP